MHHPWRSWWALCLLAVPAWAGGGPQQALVVVNSVSSNSVALGRHYADQRGIPPQLVFRIATTNERNISTAAFSNEIRGPIEAYLEASGLDDQVDYIVFSRDIPYRVFDGDFTNSFHAGLTSSMYDRFIASPNAFAAGCQIAAGSLNDYFAAERAFRRPDPPANARYRIAAMLTASNQAQAIDLIDRAAASDFTRPAAAVYFEHGSDFFRNVRWVGYENAAYAMRFVTNGPAVVAVDAFDDPTPRTNAIGLMTGVMIYPRFSNTTFVAGAIADHLTSFAGFLFNSTEGEGYREPNQMKIPSWIANGAAGSYGTVVEPCAYPEKFTDPRMHLWYGRGFSLGESVYMAVKHPYQGLLVGDPLAQPYATPPWVAMAGVETDEVVSGTVSLWFTGRVDDAEGGVDRLDWYVDDRLVDVAARHGLGVSNIITLTVSGEEVAYTVADGDALPDVVEGLADAVNNLMTGGLVRAVASGDRIELMQRIAGGSGTGIAYAVTVAQGAGTNLGLLAWTAGERLVDSTFHAYATSRLIGVVQSGDVVRAKTRRLDGVVITNELVAGAGWTAHTMMREIRLAVNAHPDLQGPEGVYAGRYSQNPYATDGADLVFRARTPGWSGTNGAISYTSSNPALSFPGGGSFNNNTNVLGARGMVFVSAGATQLAASALFDTTAWPDGPHTWRVVAHRGDGPGTQGHAVRAFQIKNHGVTCAIVAPTNTGLVSWYEPVVRVAASDTNAAVTGVVVWADGVIAAASNGAPPALSLDPAALGLGKVTLQAQAWNSAGQSALSDPVEVTVSRQVVTSNGVPHAWLDQFGIAPPFDDASVDDPDSDGAATWEEYVMNTHPGDSNSVLRMQAVDHVPPGDVVSWFAATGRLYTLESVPWLSNGWMAVSGAVDLAGGQAERSVTNGSSHTTRYYRVGVRLP